MKSLRFLDRRAGYSLASLGMLLGMIIPAVVPTFASAAQVSSRSITLSSSAVSATNVTYEVKFTPTQTAGAFVVAFCDDSPIPGQTCTAPTGFTVGSVASATSGVTQVGKVGGTMANALEATLSMTASTPVDVTFTGLTNPSYTTDTSAHHGFYARVITYDTHTNADAYSTSTPAEGTGAKDDGGIAMAITNSIGVTAAVRETMTFCVAGNASMNAAGPSGACGVDASGGAATGLDTSHIGLSLGHGTPAALDSSAVDTASDWAQISTNASGGAVVRMTNTNAGNCSGLFRTSATGCDIAGVGTAAPIAAGNALFGMLLGTPTSAPFSVATPTGSITPLAPYDGTSGNYGMGAGVTSTYGDPIFNTGGAPISNKNVQLTFGASAAPTTPAGIYQATMNLIATGTF